VAFLGVDQAHVPAKSIKSETFTVLAFQRKKRQGHICSVKKTASVGNVTSVCV